MTPDNPEDHQETPPTEAGVPDELAGAAPPDAAAAPAKEGRPSRKAAWLAMGAVALALALIWVAPGVTPRAADQGAAASGSSAADSAAAGNPGEPDDSAVEGKPAPLQFTLKDMNGLDVKLASFKGKVIVLNFWATWCGPCRAEIPSLVDLQKQYSKDLVVLGVSVDDPIEKLKPYASEMKMNYPVLVGNGREDVQDAYGPLWGIPVSVFIDRDGKIAKKHSGIASREQFEQEIKSLL